MSAPIRIFAWGNRGRRDDGVALALAQQFEIIYAGNDEVVVHQYHQLGPELVDELSASRLAIFIDAHVGSLADDCAITRLAPADSADLSSHHCRPEVLLALCRALGRPVPAAYLVSIRAHDLAYGDQVSKLTGLAMGEAREAVVQLVNTTQRCAKTH
jgi:hydrogenase maturation protease